MHPASPHNVTPAKLPHTLPMPWLGDSDPLLIGLVGRAGSGKSTAADYLADTWGGVQYAWANPIKDLLAQLFEDRNVDHAHLEEPHLKCVPLPQFGGLSARQLMQSLGDWGRGLSPTWWIDQGAYRLGLAGHDRSRWAPVHDRIVISDVRYPNEAEWILDRGGVLLRIYRSTASRTSPAHPYADHSSETHADHLPVHMELHNEGHTKAELYHQLHSVMAALGVPNAAHKWRVRPAARAVLERAGFYGSAHTTDGLE